MRAPPPPGGPTSDRHFDFAPLADGVVFGRARPAGGALANSGIVDLGPTTLVFDTSLTPSAAEEIARTAVERTGRRAGLVVNSHWHLDHLLGNQVFGGTPILATRRTRAILEEQRASLEREVAPATLRADVAELERKLAAARTPEGRAYLAEVLALNRWVLRAAPTLRLTLPDRPFEGRHPLPGDRPAELLGLGAGHTESDAVLHLPSERLLFAGDLVVVGTHPNLTSGDPVAWRRYLAELRRLRPERIVPGHGPVASAEAIEAVDDYLATIVALAEAPGTPEVPARFRDWSGVGQFEENVAYLRGGRTPPEGPGDPGAADGPTDR